MQSVKLCKLSSQPTKAKHFRLILQRNSETWCFGCRVGRSQPTGKNSDERRTARRTRAPGAALQGCIRRRSHHLRRSAGPRPQTLAQEAQPARPGLRERNRENRERTPGQAGRCRRNRRLATYRPPGFPAAGEVLKKAFYSHCAKARVQLL